MRLYRFAGAVILLTTAACSGGGSSGATTLDLRPVVTELPATPCKIQSGSSDAVFPEMRLGLSAACFRVGPIVFTMSRTNVASADAMQGNNGWAVDIALTPKAAIEFDGAVGRFQGHQVAVINGHRVLSAPTIEAVHFNGRAEVSGLDKAGAQRIAAGLRH